MTRKLCWAGRKGIASAFGITLEQDGPDDFTVTYGKQVRAHLSYGAAATELGACIMHALALDGMLDNRDPEEVAAEEAEEKLLREANEA
jgi:hypothetical protein